MDLDFSDDYQIFDNMEAITLRRIQNNASVPLAKSLRSPVTKKEMEASNGAYLTDDVTWLLPGDLLGSVRPTPGDTILDSSGVTWTILDQSTDHLTGDYVCTCRDLVLVFGLRDAITIERPTNAKDGSGNRVPTYAAVVEYTDLPAKIQEQEATREENFGKVGMRRRYTVWIDRRIVVSNEDQLVCRGVVYQILSYSNTDRIGELMRLEVEIIP